MKGTRITGHGDNNNKLIILIFSFFFLVNVVSSGGHLDWWDGIEAFLVTESMVLKHTAKLDPSVPSVEKLHHDIRFTVVVQKATQLDRWLDMNTTPLEPVYINRSLLLSAIAVPFYYAALILSVPPIAVIGLLVNSLFISLTCVTIFCFSIELFGSKKIAYVLSIIFGVCSFIWPYNTTFWSQPLQALTLISSAFFLYKSLHYNSSFICHYTRLDKNRGIIFAGLGGLFLGLSVFAHATSLIFVPGFIAYSVFSMRRYNAIRNLVSFIAILGITLLFMGLINYLRFGDFTEFGYGYFASLEAHNAWRGLIGLLVSPGAGLFFYFPIAILLPFGAKYMLKEHKALFLLFAYILIINWLNVGTLSHGYEPYAWSGAQAWGPRYLIPVLPFITIILGYILPHLKKKAAVLKASFVVLCIASFLINSSGVLVWFHYGIMYGWEKEQLAGYPDSMDIMTWQPAYSPILLHLKSLLTDYVSTIHPEQYVNTSWNWTAYGLAPCSYDIYLFCKFGITPILILSSVIIFLGILVLIQIRAVNILYNFLSKKIFRTKQPRQHAISQITFWIRKRRL